MDCTDTNWWDSILGDWTVSSNTTLEESTEDESQTGQATPDEKQELEARIRELEAETERLRRTAAVAYRRRYRRSAFAMGVLGLIAFVGAVLFTNVRTVLIALGGTGLFAAILTYFLTPERFVAATIGERVYGTTADNETAIVEDLDLQGVPHLVPATGSAAPARLFVPLNSSIAIPESINDDAPFRLEEQQGLALEPTGAALYELLVDTNGTLPNSVDALASIVADALLEQFELVDTVDVDTEPGRATLAVNESAFGQFDQFDHPVASFLATTIAVEQDTPVRIEIDQADDRSNWLVTCRWDIKEDEPVTRSQEPD